MFGAGLKKAVNFGLETALSLNQVTHWSSQGAYSEPTRYVGQGRRAHRVGRGDRGGRYQGMLPVLSTPTRRAGRWAAAGPSVNDCGTHRNSEQSRESEPGTPVASNPRNALQNEGQGSADTINRASCSGMSTGSWVMPVCIPRPITLSASPMGIVARTSMGSGRVGP